MPFAGNDHISPINAVQQCLEETTDIQFFCNEAVDMVALRNVSLTISPLVRIILGGEKRCCCFTVSLGSEIGVTLDGSPSSSHVFRMA